MKTLRIVGTASPEGVSVLNARLSESERRILAAWLEEHLSVEEAVLDIQASGIDWEGLERAVAASDMPYRDEVLEILRNTPCGYRDGKVEIAATGNGYASAAARVAVYGRAFLSRTAECRRASGLRDGMFRTRRTRSAAAAGTCARTRIRTVAESAPVPVELLVQPESPARKPFYMSLKTNLLYDAALIPNIGAEFYAGRRVVARRQLDVCLVEERQAS